MIKHRKLPRADDCTITNSENSLTINLLDDKTINSRSHVHCLDTGKVLEIKFDFPNSAIERAIQEFEEKTGIQIVEYRFDLLGYQNLRNR